MYKCKQCNKEFTPKRKDAQFCRKNCKNNWHVTKARRDRKAKLIEYFGGECILCGYNKSVWALHFHHRNPEEKEFALGSDGNCRSWEKDLQEALKCDLICANCHAEVHSRD